MTKQLLVFGNSLVDAGNTAFVFSQAGVDNPYEDPIYAGGGNVKTSDGLCGEACCAWDGRNR